MRRGRPAPIRRAPRGSGGTSSPGAGAVSAGWTSWRPGTTHRAVTVGDIAVVLTFEDRPRAFANTCRHRGHELLQCDEAGDRQSVVCPYHGWSYELDGSVKLTRECR